MAFTIRYAKPNMADLPPTLGKAIIKQILNTKKPDDEQLSEEARKLEKEMVKVRDLEDAQRDISE
ncbi:MAG: hypothetical protein J6I76_05275 [Oribacterium sp.]|nr:hypothetical protein [Oribacterium sp.]MBR1856514.1 hypothetical protein [Oribacterium sp.]